MKRETKIVRTLLMVPVVMVLLVSVAGCGIVSDQTKQEAKNKVEARKQQVEHKAKKKVETGRKDVNDLQDKVDELLKKLDAQEKQNK